MRWIDSQLKADKDFARRVGELVNEMKVEQELVALGEEERSFPVRGPSLGEAGQRASASVLARPNAPAWTTRQPGEALPLRTCEPRRAGCE
jgi:hypothetical protein